MPLRRLVLFLSVLLLTPLAIATGGFAQDNSFEYWRFYNGRAKAIDTDRDGIHDYGPTISCGAARTLKLYLALNEKIYKRGQSVAISLFADGVEFRFVGNAKERWTGDSDISVVASLAAPLAAAFIQQFPVARNISWSINRGTPVPFTRIGVGNTFNALAKECNIPLNLVFDQQRALAWTGFFHDLPSGRADAATRRAIASWQRSHGRAPTGVLSTSEEIQLVEESWSITGKIGWRRHSAAKGFVTFQYPSMIFALPETPNWIATAWDDQRIEFGLDITKDDDSKATYDQLFAELTKSSPARTIVSSSRNAVWFSLEITDGDTIRHMRVERRMNAVAIIQISLPKDAADPLLWRRIFSMISDSLIVDIFYYE